MGSCESSLGATAPLYHSLIQDLKGSSSHALQVVVVATPRGTLRLIHFRTHRNIYFANTAWCVTYQGTPVYIPLTVSACDDQETTV